MLFCSHREKIQDMAVAMPFASSAFPMLLVLLFLVGEKMSAVDALRIELTRLRYFYRDYASYRGTYLLPTTAEVIPSGANYYEHLYTLPMLVGEISVGDSGEVVQQNATVKNFAIDLSAPYVDRGRGITVVRAESTRLYTWECLGARNLSEINGSPKRRALLDGDEEEPGALWQPFSRLVTAHGKGKGGEGRRALQESETGATADCSVGQANFTLAK